MDEILVQVPEEFKIIQDNLLKSDWIISSFDIDKIDLYNPANYLYYKVSDGLTYKLYLDRNIFSLIIAAANKKQSKKLYRDAISLVIFCQIAEILIEPNFAVYEKINYSDHNVDEAVSELLTFYNIDSTRTDILMNYVLNKEDSLNIVPAKKLNRKTLKEELTKYKWLAEWRSLYLIVLNLVDLNYQRISRDKKMDTFFNWMVKEFRLSLVSIVYAIFLFSSGRLKRMIKFKPDDNRNNRISQLRNMTWDLYFMNQFLRVWQNLKENEDFIFASSDSVVREVLFAAILIKKNKSLKVLKDYLHAREEKYLHDIDKLITSGNNRVYGSKKWSPEYRDKLIEEKESILLS